MHSILNLCLYNAPDCDVPATQQNDTCVSLLTHLPGEPRSVSTLAVRQHSRAKCCKQLLDFHPCPRPTYTSKINNSRKEICLLEINNWFKQFPDDSLTVSNSKEQFSFNNFDKEKKKKVTALCSEKTLEHAHKKNRQLILSKKKEKTFDWPLAKMSNLWFLFDTSCTAAWFHTLPPICRKTGQNSNKRIYWFSTASLNKYS